MFYENSFWGMNLLWWAAWSILLFWIFATPYDIPFQRQKGTALDILQKRLAAGLITNEDYYEKKEILDNGRMREEFRNYLALS